MGGFNTITGDETIGFSDNFSFDGTERNGKLEHNKYIWAGCDTKPHVRKTLLNSSDGSVTFSMMPNVLPDLGAVLDIKAVGGGGSIPTNIGVDVTSGSGGNPAIPDASHIITITGGQVSSGTVGADVIRTDCFSPSSVRIEIQRTGSSGAENTTLNGVAHFDSAAFTVSTGGFVSLGGAGILQTLTGNSGGAVSPTGGNINTLGTGSITIVGNPGTSTTTTELTGLTAHNLLIGQGTPTIGLLAPGTTNQVLMTNSGADPSWSTATYPRTTTINQLFYSSATNTVSEIPTLNDGVLITGNTGIPSWLANGTTGYVLTATAGAPPSWQPITAGNNGLTWLITVNANSGDTNINITNIFNSTYDTYLIIGYNLQCSNTGQLLFSQFGTGVGPTWQTTNYRNSSVSTTTAMDLFEGTGGTTANGDDSFKMVVLNVNNANRWKAALSDTLVSLTGSSLDRVDAAHRWENTTLSPNSIRFFWSLGTWVTGTIAVYGYHK